MPSQGPRSPGTASNNNSVGNVSWSNITNILTQDDQSATVTLASGNITHYAQGTNFGFDSVLPQNIDIVGILLEYRCRRLSSSNAGRDNSVRLRKNSGYVGNDKADTATNWPTSLTYLSRGGPTDLWGTTWTRSAVVATNFGAGVSAYIDGNTVYIDHMRITIYYEASSGFFSATQAISLVGGAGIIVPALVTKLA